jgi:hypothetical protein
MNKKLALFALPALLVAGFASAQTLVGEDFESYAPYNTGSGGAAYVPFVSEYFTTSGAGEGEYVGGPTVIRSDGNYYSEEENYITGYGNMYQATLSHQMLFNWAGTTTSYFDYTPEGTFNLVSFMIASGHGTQTVEIVGFLDGAQVASMSLDLTVNPTFVAFGNEWKGLDSFTITNGTNFVPDYDDDLQTWVIDNMLFAPVAVPEPGLAAMFGVGLAVVGLLRRRQLKLRK